MEFPRNDFITKAKKAGHSADFIKATLRYADSLDEKGLPVIFDRNHLAFLLMMDIQELLCFVRESSCFYKYFAIKKKRGGLRRIIAPYSNLRKIQVWIKECILDKIEQPYYVTAFAKNRNTLKNARIHEDKKYILKFDIADFFESICFKQVNSAFCNMGYLPEVSSCLARLCTSKIDEYKYSQLEEQKDIQALFDDLKTKNEAFLIQGAPTSPALANIVCYRMDRRIIGLSKGIKFNYSRYADDMTFSADRLSDLPKVGMIRRIVESEGFHLNDQKTQLLHIGKRQIVTGLLVDGHVRVPGRYKKDIWRHIHFCLKYGGRDHFNRIAPGLAYGKEWLEGRIRYVYSVEPAVAKNMWVEFEKIDWGY